MAKTTWLYALGAGAFCLLAYPGIFSRLSNDGKQSPVPFIILLVYSVIGMLPSFIPGPPIRQGLNKLQHILP